MKYVVTVFARVVLLDLSFCFQESCFCGGPYDLQSCEECSRAIRCHCNGGPKLLEPGRLWGLLYLMHAVSECEVESSWVGDAAKIDSASTISEVRRASALMSREVEK